MRKNIIGFATTAIFLAVLAMIFLAPQAIGQKKKGRPPASVEVSAVVEREVSSFVDLVGSARALTETKVAAEITGRIVKFIPREGDHVAMGQSVCQLDDTLNKIRVREAKGALEKAVAVLKKSERAAKRATELYQEKIASLENKENSDLDVDGSRASLQLAKAAADKAEYDLERVKITAPFEGVITQRYVDIGGWVEKGDPIFEMVNIGRVEVIAEIPERHISTTTNATTAQIVFDAFPNKIVSGKIAAIAPKANSKTRTFPVRIVIDNPDYKIKAGMFARVRIPTTERKKAVLIPRDAVVWRFRKALVFSADSKGVVSSAIVRLGRQYGEMVEAQGDIKPGKKLIVTGNEILRDGQIVRVVGEKKL